MWFLTALKNIIERFSINLDEYKIKNGLLYAFIILFALFIIKRMSGIIVWITILGVISFIGYKIYVNYIKPMIDEQSQEDDTDDRYKQ